MERNIQELKEIARKLRIDILRMITLAGSGHPGGSLSAIDILVALYWRVMRHDPKNPNWPERDRFVLSKGHAAPALYAVLAEWGYFPKDDLWKLRKIDSHLQGHPSHKDTPGVEASTGSLGQGFSVAVGMALGLRLSGSDATVYVMLGDGELDEGQTWEAALSAGHYKLDNLVAILDHNGLQIDGFTRDVMDTTPLEDKFRAFKWATRSIDGHDFDQILDAFEWAKSVKGQPALIVANTIKGKGVSFMENKVEWHGKAPTWEQFEMALKELESGTE
ncbi:MAG: transketolase [Candidatus Hydrothermota bacterium]|nr:MAG: transketolase [Candidatus Hydrothermae bacterium]